MERININDQLAELMSRAGDPVDIDEDGRLQTHWPVPVQLWTWAQPIREEPGRVITQLDVWMRWPDGRECCESFGDIGANRPDALRANLDSFQRCSLPVLWVAANERAPDQYWELDGRRYGVYLGDGVMKYCVDDYLVPPDWLDFIREQLAEVFADPDAEGLVAGDWHLVRAYYMQQNERCQGCDFLLNGQPLVAAEEGLQQLAWVPREAPYSLRQFLLLRRWPD